MGYALFVGLIIIYLISLMKYGDDSVIEKIEKEEQEEMESKFLKMNHDSRFGPGSKPHLKWQERRKREAE